MTPEQNAAYVVTQAACTMIEAMGMQAQNTLANSDGVPQPYGVFEFRALIEKYGIHHNAVCSTMEPR